MSDERDKRRDAATPMIAKVNLEEWDAVMEHVGVPELLRSKELPPGRKEMIDRLIHYCSLHMSGPSGEGGFVPWPEAMFWVAMAAFRFGGHLGWRSGWDHGWDARVAYDAERTGPQWQERRQDFVEHRCELDGRIVGTVREYADKCWAAVFDPFEKLGSFADVESARLAVLEAARQRQ